MSRDCAREVELLVRAGWRLVALESFEEDRAQKALERAARACERPLRLWTVAGGLAPGGEGAGSLDAGLRAIEACEEPGLFALLDAQRELGDTRAVRRLRDLLARAARRGQALVLVGPVLDLPLELVREAGWVDLPLPRAAELEPLFRKLAGEPAPDPDALAACVRAALGLGASEAVRVFRKALLGAGGVGDEAAAWIVREKREALRRTPALSFHEAGGALADVGGLSELKRWLAERRRAFGEEARAFRLPAPRGLLLLGVQGCGKSLSAKAVAREWNFPLLRLDLAAAFGAAGDRSPELALREAMSVAESLAPAVLWIDEIEKAFASPERDARGNRIFGSFLTWLSEKDAPVFVVATANDVSSLPPELLRRGRFDEIFFVDLPSPAERLEILAIHLRRRGRDPAQFDLEALAAAAERLSGAELEQAVSAALYTAFAQGRDLEDNDLANAIAETVPLYETYEERIKELRNWARTRARPASVDAKLVDLFQAR
jgi:AAA+ superfamily predicted ATPase